MGPQVTLHVIGRLYLLTPGHFTSIKQKESFHPDTVQTLSSMKLLKYTFLFCSLFFDETKATTGQVTSDMFDLARLRTWIGMVKSNSRFRHIPVDRNQLKVLDRLFVPKYKARQGARARLYSKYLNSKCSTHCYAHPQLQ